MAQTQRVEIQAPKMRTAMFTIEGTAPYIQHKWSVKAREEMKEKQEAGSVGKNKRKRDPKNFQQCFKDAQYCAADGGWNGIPAAAIRNACITPAGWRGFR